MEISTASALLNIKPVKWGRESNAQWGHTLGALALIVFAPLLVLLDWVALEHYQGSLWAAIVAAHATEVGIYTTWVLSQAILYQCLPGPTCSGQLTPGGCILIYSANGFSAWVVTHLLYFLASAVGLIDPAGIASHWGGLLATANLYGLLLAGSAQLKGYLSPSFPQDQKITGCWAFDFWAGVELNPQFGSFDLKFFHNGRPGIMAWTMIDLSWAAYQYNNIGHITDSMVVVLLLHALYVIDFFWNEEWYIRTVDISHDHFGFMLAWGDTTFLPSFYTLQAQYLARYPADISRTKSILILALGFVGYVIFRSANHQRYSVRAKADDPKVSVWGVPATFIRCKYRTADGNEHDSILLMSGWWGLARHTNYLGDLILAWSMCATCGFTHFLPWSYFFYLLVLLLHRARRDERRCRNKYGKYWEQYCQAVPYLLVPGVY